MHTKTNGIRKAAILVASLDRPAADRLLDQMDPGQAQRVWHAVMELGEVDPTERRQIVEEFFRMGQLLPQTTPPGIELDAALAARLSAVGLRGEAAGEPTATPAGDARPFHFLQEAEGEKVARILVAERPQTIALVLAHLSPEQAAAVLARFAPGMQVEVIRRLVDLEETQPEILRDVERTLESRLSEQIHMQRRRVAGLSAVTSILEASGDRAGMQILDNLAACDRSLADKLGPERLEFAELALLDDSSLHAVFEAAEPEESVLALVGAQPALLDRVLGLLPEPQASQLRWRLDHPGPTRLSDVEEARDRLAELARRLAFTRGLPGGRRAGAVRRTGDRSRVAA